MSTSDPIVAMTYGPSGVGKCLTGESRVLLSTGAWITVEELIRTQPQDCHVVGMTEAGRLTTARISKYWQNGKKTVARVRTKKGRSLTVTLNHPLYGKDGWQPVSKFEVGDFIAVPRELAFFGREALPEHEVKYLAYHLANGLFANSAVLFSSGSEEVVRDFTEAALAFKGTKVQQVMLHGQPTIDYRISKESMSGGRWREAPVSAFLRKHGLEECAAAQKFVPAAVFTLPREQVALFLNRYLGCDGAVEATGAVSFSSASERLLHDVAHLLLRFGVRGGIRSKVVNGKTYWEWVTRSYDSITRLHEIGVFTKPLPQPAQPTRTDRWDRLPLSRREAYAQVGVSFPGGDGYITRSWAVENAPAGSALQIAATSDIYWDTIKEIEVLGEQETYDLTVPEIENFVANDIFAHNTTDLGYSFPRALFLAAPGALTSIEKTCGFKPDSTQVLDIQTATDILERVATKYDTVVIDDFSFMAEQTLQKLEAKFSGFTLWGELRRLVLEFRDKSRKAGVNVIMNAWEQPPKKNASGQRIRGGPKLSGNLPEAVPALCDIVLRAVYDTARQPWPVVYQCSADPNWILKDRYDLVPRLGSAPMNLAEILRASGVKVERHPNLEGQEEKVETISQKFSGDPAEDLPKANTIFKAMIEAGVPYTEARWTMRDAMDRAVIRAGLKAAQNSFVISTGHLF